jgi:hypothetical protein
VILEPQLVKENDYTINKIGNVTMKRIFKEFVEENPEYIKQILSKIFKYKEN